jgi:hypothetical protein
VGISYKTRKIFLSHFAPFFVLLSLVGTGSLQGCLEGGGTGTGNPLEGSPSPLPFPTSSPLPKDNAEKPLPTKGQEVVQTFCAKALACALTQNQAVCEYVVSNTSGASDLIGISGLLSFKEMIRLESRGDLLIDQRALSNCKCHINSSSCVLGSIEGTLELGEENFDALLDEFRDILDPPFSTTGGDTGPLGGPTPDANCSPVPGCSNLYRVLID